MRARIERGKRLVEQQQARPHQQRAADRDALALAARKSSRPPLEQVADIEQLDHVFECRRVGFAAADPAPVFQILPDSDVRKQPAFLEHIADAPAPGRHVDSRGTVEQHFAIELDAAAIRPHETGNHVDHAGLARARGAEQRGHAGFARERDVAARTRRGAFRHRPRACYSPCRRAVARRASHSDATSAAKQMTMATTTSLSASASPPGTCVNV